MPSSPSIAVPTSLPQEAGQRRPASSRREQSLHRGRAAVRNVPQREGGSILEHEANTRKAADELTAYCKGSDPL